MFNDPLIKAKNFIIRGKKKIKTTLFFIFI